MKLEHLESRRLLAGTASISGAVYDDLNANGIHEAGEAGIKNVRVYLDSNGNGKWEKGKESSVRTDARGGFSFEHLDATTYRLRHVVNRSTTVMAPRSDWFKITLTDGQHVTRRLFGDYTASKGTSPSPNVDGGLSGGATFNGRNSYTGIVFLGMLVDAEYKYFADVDHNGTVDFREAAAADFKSAKGDGGLPAATAWLTGDKRQRRTDSVEDVIDHYHEYGVDYKRAFLQLAKV